MNYVHILFHLFKWTTSSTIKVTVAIVASLQLVGKSSKDMLTNQQACVDFIIITRGTREDACKHFITLKYQIKIVYFKRIWTEYSK
jgi:predicted nucleic acid-binding Zn finger protein